MLEALLSFIAVGLLLEAGNPWIDVMLTARKIVLQWRMIWVLGGCGSMMQGYKCNEHLTSFVVHEELRRQVPHYTPMIMVMTHSIS